MDLTITNILLFLLSCSILYFARVSQIKHKFEKNITSKKEADTKLEKNDEPYYEIITLPDLCEQPVDDKMLEYDTELDEITKKLESPITVNKDERLQLEKRYDELIGLFVNRVIEKVNHTIDNEIWPKY